MDACTGIDDIAMKHTMDGVSIKNMRTMLIKARRLITVIISRGLKIHNSLHEGLGKQETRAKIKEPPGSFKNFTYWQARHSSYFFGSSVSSGSRPLDSRVRSQLALLSARWIDFERQ